MTNLKTSPPAPQPKQWYSLSTGSIPNDGERSSWNGHSPAQRRTPALRSSVRAPTSSTKSTASRTFSRESSEYLGNEPLRHVPLGPGADREAVGHPGDVVDHAVLGRDLEARLGQLLRVLAEPLEEPGEHAVDACVLLARRLAQVHVLEHEGPQREHRAADLLALDDV